MNTAGATIIVVEDEPGVRATLCGILVDTGYKVIGLESGADALQMLRKGPFDVIIADIRLPDISGLEILELAKEINPEAAVIMMTGYASVETAVDAVNQGAYAYFVKPVNPDELKTAIANILKQQRLSLENKGLVESLQQSNELLRRANEELRGEIAERKRVEEALQESEEKYRLIIENSSSAITYFDTEGKYVFVNRQGIKNHGGRDVTGMSMYDTHPKVADFHIERLSKIMKEGKGGKFEDCFELPGGKRCFSSDIQPMKDDRGNIIGVQVISDDITERKQAEEALKESEARYRALIDLGGQVGEAVVMLQDEGPKEAVHAFCSDAWLQITGYSREELRNMTFGELEHPRDREASLARHRRRISGESIPELFELTIIRKDGTEVPIEVNSAYNIYRGKPVTVLYARDITERKRMEEELKESEEKLRLMFESLALGVAVLDLGARIVHLNDAKVRMHGYDSKEDLLGRSLLEFVAEKDRSVIRDNLKRKFEDGYVGAVEYTLLRRDGEEFPVKASVNVLRDASGKPIGYIAITEDITARKRMEEELIEKTREVEEATRLKSEFLAHMSHELRTPLNAIIGFSELMLDKVPGEINEEQRQCLEDILNSGKHLLNLINDVLDLSKIESGKVEFRMENVALSEVIEPLVRTMAPILAPRKQSLDVEIEKGIPLVYADEAKLGQVLLNLVDNSSKFTPDGGRLKIKATRKDGWCRVSVIDNGVGIKKEDQRKLFEPFSQLDNSPRKEKNGTGLGLALVGQIIERYGGRIWVESELGKGSQFIFTLPLQKPTSDVR